jgi:hypothetical protein
MLKRAESAPSFLGLVRCGEESPPPAVAHAKSSLAIIPTSPQRAPSLPRGGPSRRIIKAGSRSAAPDVQLRHHLLRTAAALESPLPTPMEARAYADWADSLSRRQHKLTLQRKRQHTQQQAEVDTLDAQLDALGVLTCGSIFINPVDRETLLGLIGEMRSLRTPLEPSPLAMPEVKLLPPPEPSSGRSSPAAMLPTSMRRAPGASPPGGDPLLAAQLSRTITFAHRRRQQQEQATRSPAARHPPPGTIVPIPDATADDGGLSPPPRARAVKRGVRTTYMLQHADKVYREQRRRAKLAEEEGKEVIDDVRREELRTSARKFLMHKKNQSLIRT